jgi:ammonium transporter, Amt family
MKRLITPLTGALLLVLAFAIPGAAEEAAVELSLEKVADMVADAAFRTDNLWIVLSAALVFIMHLGFATLETGLTRAKNTTNILFKNVMIVCIGLITYLLIGFNLMYPGDFNIIGGVLGFAGPGIHDWAAMKAAAGAEGATEVAVAAYAGLSTKAYGDYTYWADFLFQGMFAATAATIISGCVAERIKLGPFLIFATIYVGILYPFVGSWHWGGGWIAGLGFYDFAGSTLVHSVGGWGGLAAILVLGPRSGKYAADGSVRPIVGHSMPLATIGVFLLWLGWFGFNGGSVLSASPDDIAYVCTTTSIAAGFGGVTAAITSWIITKKPDLTMALNGILAGLVGITAGPDTTLPLTVIIGIVCGIAVFFAVIMFDKLKIDDPVGALSVHLVCGIIGTLFAAAVADGGIVAQVIGIGAYGITCFVFALVTALIVKAIFGWRVSPEEEDEGLDLGEHGMPAYHALEVR